LALAIGALIGGGVSSEGDARRRGKQTRMRKVKNDRNTKRGKRNKKKKNKNEKDKKKSKKDKKGKGGSGSTSGSCTVQHSEQQILAYISQAARKYGQPERDMVRVARCESTLNPCAVNHSGPYYGLFQYLKSTWRSTPYGNRDIFDPEAQALATGWMWKQGRRNEWVCQ
jgi:hypothetical protein